MKKKASNQNRIEAQIQGGIQDTYQRKNNFVQKSKTTGPVVPNHSTFGVAGGMYCTGPPGRARSPGFDQCLYPDHPPDEFAVCIPDQILNPVRHKDQHNTEYQQFINKIIIQIITHNQNFNIMKKQILILTFFVLAMMAGSSTAFGQLLPGVTKPTNIPLQPIPAILCATNALPLHPVPGMPFTYTMTNGAGAETSKNWSWWATQDPGFVTAPGTTNNATKLTVAAGDLIGTSADYGTSNLGTALGSPSVTITWSAGILANTKYQAVAGDAPKKSTFVVGYSEGNACADNIQVFEINPAPNFTIDIAAIDPTTSVTADWTDDTKELCVDKVQTATYDPLTHEITMDYGTNTIYYEVAAANFVANWAPTFQIISGLRTTQTAVISMYSTLADAQAVAGVPLWTSAPILVAGMNTAIPTTTALTASVVADVATGVSVYVKVLIDNNREESLTDNPFILAVDAQDNTIAGVPQVGSSIWDMEDADCPTLADAADQIDQATITVNPRPTMDMDGGAMSEPSLTNPENVILKTP